MLFSNNGRHSHKYVDKKQQDRTEPDTDPAVSDDQSEPTEDSGTKDILNKGKTQGPRITEKENKVNRMKSGTLIVFIVLLAFSILLYAATDGFTIFSDDDSDDFVPIAEMIEPEELLADAAAPDSGNLTSATAVAINDETAVYVADEAVYDELIEAVKRNGTEQIEGQIISVKIKENVEPVGVVCRKEAVKTMEDALTYIFNKGEPLKQYTAEKKEDLKDAALANKTSVERILTLNKDLTEKSALKKGQTIKVDSQEHLINLDIVAQTKEEIITEEYMTEVQESSEWLKGTEIVVQEGQNGITEITREQTYSEGVLTGEKIIEEKEVQKAVNEIIVVGTAEKTTKDDAEKDDSAEEDDSSAENDGT